MKIGARWRRGEDPHASVPVALHGLIREVESDVSGGTFWLLTWLEGKPICDLDGLAQVTVDTANVPIRMPGSDATLEDDENDDWLLDS